MLHAAIINFRRRIVNRTRGFSCRAAAQFNPGLEVLRWDCGGAVEGEGEDLGWPSRSFSIHQFTANRQMRLLLPHKCWQVKLWVPQASQTNRPAWRLALNLAKSGHCDQISLASSPAGWQVHRPEMAVFRHSTRYVG